MRGSVTRLTYQPRAGGPPDRDMLTEPHNSRSLPRRRVYLGEGLTLRDRAATPARGRGDRPDPRGPRARGRPRDRRECRRWARSSPSATPAAGASGPRSRRSCATSAACETGRGTLPRLGLSLVPETTVADVDRREGVRYPCPEALPAFATAACPWFFRERLRFRIVRGRRRRDDAARGAPDRAAAAAAWSSTSSCTSRSAPSSACAARVTRCGGRTSRRRVGRSAARAATARSRDYLLAADATLTPARAARGRPRRRQHRAGGHLRLRHVDADYEEILALRLHAHQARGPPRRRRRSPTCARPSTPTRAT